MSTTTTTPANSSRLRSTECHDPCSAYPTPPSTSPRKRFHPSSYATKEHRSKVQCTQPLSREIMEMILDYSDNETLGVWRHVNSRLRDSVHARLLKRIEVNFCIARPKDNSDYAWAIMMILGFYATTPSLVRHLRIKDDAQSRMRSAHYENVELRGEAIASARKYMGLCPGSVYLDDHIAKIIGSMTALETLEVVYVDYQLDWLKYENWHFAADVSSVFRLQSLTSISLKGVVNIPLAEIEQAKNLTSLSLCSFSFCFDGVWGVPSRAHIFLNDLKLWDIRDGADDIAGYLSASTSVVSVKKLRTFNGADVKPQHNQSIAAAVLDSVALLFSGGKRAQFGGKVRSFPIWEC